MQESYHSALLILPEAKKNISWIQNIFQKIQDKHKWQFFKERTIEWLHTGCIIVNEGWRHPHNAQDEQSQQEEHHKGLKNTRLNALAEKNYKEERKI